MTDKEAFIQHSGNTYLFNTETKEIKRIDKDGGVVIISDKKLIEKFNNRVSALENSKNPITWKK